MRQLERANAAGNLAAFKSLAESRNVPLERVLEAASEGRLIDIVEMREVRRPLNPSLPGWGAKDPIDCLTVLAFKSRDPFLM
jgi:hypothetical protein